MKIRYIFIGEKRRVIIIDHTFNRWQLLESLRDVQFVEPDLTIQLRLYSDYKALLNTLQKSRYIETINKMV